MKIGYLGLFATSVGTLWAGVCLAETHTPAQAINNVSLLDDPRIIAALVAAAVTLLVNIIGKLVLDRRLEAFKADLKEKGVVNEAKLQYELEEKRRLYHAIGHLRFQLLLSARDVARHVVSLAENKRRYPTTTKNYYGQSTLFKLVRPIALCELIERQISVADFSVDTDSIELLKLKRSIFKCFSSAEAILHHPDANWHEQEQHIFYHSLSRISNAIIVDGGDGTLSPMPFHEFEEFISDDANSVKMAPLPDLLEDFSIEEKPLLWLRFVLYGFLCAELVKQKGVPIGFELVEFPLEELIGKVGDHVLREKRDDIPVAFKSIRDAGL